MNERYETISLAWECADCKAPLFADGEALKVHGDWHCRVVGHFESDLERFLLDLARGR